MVPIRLRKQAIKSELNIKHFYLMKFAVNFSPRQFDKTTERFERVEISPSSKETRCVVFLSNSTENFKLPSTIENQLTKILYREYF